MRKLFLFLFFSLFLTPIYAALDLELTQGMQQAVPIAVLPFVGQENTAPNNNIAQVVHNDLANSGRFKVTDSAGKSVNYQVAGKAAAMPDGRVQVIFQLMNEGDSKADAAPLLNEKFVIEPSRLRALAHHISDLVYQKITGDRGIFSTRIAYVLVERNAQPTKYLLEVSDQDGFNPKPLLISNQPIMSPAWAPDGKSLAYVSFEGGDAAIYVQNVASGGRHAVTHFPGINGAPAWSPDGRKLAVVLTKSGYPNIYILDIASGQLNQLTNDPAIDTEPNWSPDGRSIIFTSNRGGGPQIYRINIASREVQRVTYAGNYNARPAFIYDGSGIVVLTQNGSGFDLALQELGSGRIVPLTNSGDAQSPSVAPNGKMVVYADQQDQGNGVLGMVSTDGSVKLRLPAQEGDVQEPAWSPFLD